MNIIKFLLNKKYLMNLESQNEALCVAKMSILEKFGLYDMSEYSMKNSELSEERSCFVTLKKDDKLRGCIGSIYPTRSLYNDVLENAKNAAFGDSRFSPLSEDEVKNSNLHIEITVLSPITKQKFDSLDSLLDFLSKNRVGLIINLGGQQATFLPSVWEQISNPEEFLDELIYKAGLSTAEFVMKFEEVEVFTYSGEEFGKDWEAVR